MPNRIRFAPPDPNGSCLVEITIRCIQGRYLLRPSEELNARVIGVLAKGRELFPVRPHGFAFMSNHAHLLMSVSSQAQLSSYMNFINSNIAKEVNRIHDWSDKFWARRYNCTPILGGEEIQLSRLSYVLSQGTKENLVDSPYRWPGINSAGALATGNDLKGYWIDRTALCKARQTMPADQVRVIDFKEEMTLEFFPLPCFAHLPPEAFQNKVRELIEEIETTAKTARQGSGVAGRRSVRCVHPHYRPLSLETTPAPIVHASSKQIRTHFLEAYRIFVRAFRRAARGLKKRSLARNFPEGCFPPALPFVGTTPLMETNLGPRPG